jgi:hypothetical protein
MKRDVISDMWSEVTPRSSKSSRKTSCLPGEGSGLRLRVGLGFGLSMNTSCLPATWCISLSIRVARGWGLQGGCGGGCRRAAHPRASVRARAGARASKAAAAGTGWARPRARARRSRAIRRWRRGRGGRARPRSHPTPGCRAAPGGTPPGGTARGCVDGLQTGATGGVRLVRGCKGL